MAFGIRKLLKDKALPENLAFINSFIENAQINLMVEENDLGNIPEDGPFVCVANHLYGAVDSVLLIYLLAMVRQDIKIFSKYNFKNHEKLSDYFFPLPRREKRKKLLDYTDMIKAEIDAGHGMGVFPARKGGLSRLTGGLMIDKRWEPNVVDLITRLEAPIVPVFFQSDAIIKLVNFNNFSFDKLTAFYQQFTKLEKIVKVRIGKPISVKEQQKFVDVNRFGRYLRAKTYAIGSTVELNSFFPRQKREVEQYKKENFEEMDIARPVSDDLITKEIERLRHHGFLFRQEEYELFVAPATEIPNTLREIGRLREITFRNVGEGTGNSRDLDEFDVYYYQLILWDAENKKIVGGYRLGRGDEIMRVFGSKGFYISTLFRLKKGIAPVLKSGIELGRSYIRDEYQKARLPLFLLWKGILAVLIRNPHYKYLFGPVSISNAFSNVSRQVIVEFIRENFFDHDMAKFIRPRKPFVTKNKEVDIPTLLENFKGDIKNVDRFIEEIEPSHFRMPVLVKKYVKQEAKIIGFNVDPKFSNALDGFMILDLDDLPVETIENLQRDMVQQA